LSASSELGGQRRLTGKVTEDEFTLERKWAWSKSATAEPGANSTIEQGVLSERPLEVDESDI